MRDWITYNRKRFRCHAFLYFLGLTCCFIPNLTQATNISINVYLKLKPDNQVIGLVSTFIQLIQQDGLIKAYGIKPFIQTHPLHITLYLANYEEKQIPEIMKQIQIIAKQQKKLSITTGQFQASPSGYVMLTVDLNQHLQQLSNQALINLAALRNKNALIPAWASKDKERTKLFSQWGSPSVLNYFQPHFSIFDPEHLNQKQQAELHTKIQTLMEHFSKTHQVKVSATANAIGIGIADSQGQIIKELGAFELP